MSVEQNKEVTRRTIEEVMNQGKVELIPELFDPNYVHRGPGGQEVRGQEGWKQTVLNSRAAFPDIRYTIVELVGEANRVVCQHSATGTHKGDYMGIPATGKQIATGGMFVNRFEGGKVVETWGVSNPVLMYQQLGVTPPGLNQSEETNKAVLKRYFEEVLNKGNAALLDELMDENYVMVGAGGQEVIKSREGNKQYFSQGRSMASDLHVTIDEMVAEADKVAVAGAWEGTNTGPFQGNPPTGKRFKYGYTAIYRFAGGKIAGGRIVSDTLGVYQQLGIAPPSVAPAT